MTEIEYQEFVRHCPYDAMGDYSMKAVTSEEEETDENAGVESARLAERETEAALRGLRHAQIRSKRTDVKTHRRGYREAKDKEGKRVRKQLEVDFVVNQGNQRYYIQVAYDMTSEEKQTQEFNSLRNIPDSFKKIVIVNGSKKPWRNDEGFVIMGMKYFLLNANSLEF